MQQLRHLLGSLLLLATFALFTSSSTFAQDDFSLPGDDAPSPAPAAPAAPAGGGGEPGAGAAAPASADGMTLGQKIMNGGIAMFTLLFLSVVIVALGIYLAMDLSRKNFHPEHLEQSLDDSFSQADIAGALNSAAGSRTCLGAMIARGIEYIDEREATAIESEAILDHMADASVEHNQRRAFLINLLSVISQAAPMLGLLGTVSGMMKAFASLGDGNNAKELAANISEALITTFTGLAVALPAIFLYQFLRNRLNNLVTSTTRSAQIRVRTLRGAVLGSGGAGAPAGGASPINPEDPPLPPA